MKTLCIGVAALVACVGASSSPAAVLYTNTLRDGPAPGWQSANGQWAWTGSGLRNAELAENRIFLNGQAGADFFRVVFDASLNSGDGWSFFFKSTLTNGNLVTGWSFDHEPGFGTGAYLLKRWDADAQTQLAASFVPATEGQFNSFEFLLERGTFEAKRDGQTILTYTGDNAFAGGLFGFRTWYSGDATFRDFTLYGTPVPTPAGTLALGGAALVLGARRRR